MTERGEEVIKNLNSNFGVISVAGMYRTGKSYLLNRMLLNRQKGFSVGPTVNPCTKGLWIWSKPIYGTSEDGSRLPILLIDTEGFGAFDEDQNHDIRIFTLAILLCSYFVYNSAGSIDENAIQSLSFVINLSKHIHVKNTDSSFTEPDELSNLFPSFLWVLRDFALQLVDDDGELITPKEYLEKVLENNKSQYDMDQKNKIRKLIKSYFKDRDCYTMVRPLLKEKELQNLENMGPEKLRPEFLEQILQLRKKILTRVKVKTFKGKALNGEMYLNMIKSFINAINTGKVPNIDNTWNSLCKVESYKAFEEAEKMYETMILENLSANSSNLNQEIIKRIYQEAKSKSLDTYKKKSIGDVALDFEKQLKVKMREKLSYYSKLNEEETKNNLFRGLQKWYSMIEYKIQTNEIKNVEEVDYECRALEMKLNESFANFTLKNELLNDFKAKVLTFAGDYFLNKISNEMHLIKNENDQIINKLSNDIAEAKANSDKELNRKNIILENTKVEVTSLKEELAQAKEDIVIKDKDYVMLNKASNEKIERIKEENERKISELNIKLTQAEEKAKECDRRVITAQAEFEKERALLDQKIDHYAKLVDDFNKREKESGHELKSQLKEQGIYMKENQIKFENQIKALNATIEEYKEKIADLDLNVTNHEHIYTIEKNKYEELNNKYTYELKDFNEKINSMKKALNDEKVRNAEEVKNINSEYINKINLLKIKNEELEHKVKVNEEGSKSGHIRLEREYAVLKQNNEFLEIQVKDLNSSIEEMKRNHENIIQTLENKTFSNISHEEFQKKVDEIKSYFENEKKQIEESHEKNRVMYMNQIDTLQEKLNETEYKSKVMIEKLENDKAELQIRHDKLTKEYNIIANDKKSLNESLAALNEEYQNKNKILSDELDKKIEEKERIHQREMSDLNRNSEESIAQLKAIFETEKIRFEEKLKEEKLRNEKKIRYAVEEYENKIKDSESDLREEIENLQNDYTELENTHQNYIQNAEHEISMQNQRIDQLDNYLREAKEALANTQIIANNTLDQHTENFNRERKELLGKIEGLQAELANREKEITQLGLKRDQLERNLHDTNTSANVMRKEYEEEKKELIAKLENYKNKYAESHDEFMIKKLEFTRENALLKQQIEFLNKKIDELTKGNDDAQKRYEEKLFGLRTEVEKDFQEKFDRAKIEKEELEAKLLMKKKELKDLEQTFVKQNNAIEKEKTILQEKLEALKEKKKEQIEAMEKEIENLKQNSTYSKKDNEDKITELSSANELLKKRIYVLENELIEKTGTFEKDLILWEGKHKFIEQQRDNYKKDLTESQKRFENSLENIQKKGNYEKEKLETQQQSTITVLEHKYQTQIKEMNEQHSKLYQDLLGSNKELETRVKSLNLQLEFNKEKNQDNNNISKKVEELLDDKEKLKKEIEDLKKEKDQKVYEEKNLGEKEREILKLKIHEVENRIRDTEARRGALMLEYEKDKAKWSLEKDHLNSKVMELNENVERFEKKVENLLRENEKLKADKNNSKRSTSIRGSGSQVMNSNYIMNNTSILGVNQANRVDMSMYQSKPQNQTYMNKELNKIFDSDSKGKDSMDFNSSRLIDSSRLGGDTANDRYDKFVDNSSRFGNKFAIKPMNLISNTNHPTGFTPNNLNNSTTTSNTSSLNINFKDEENGNTNN